MSSHHFVKEGQEPALFILDAFSFSHVEPLLEWAPFVMVLDAALDKVLSWGIRIDAVLVQENSDMQLIQDKTMAQSPIEIFSYRSTDDPLSAGLLILSRDQKAVHVMIQITPNIFNAAQSFKDLDVVLFDQEIKWIHVKEQFGKWVPSLAEFSLRKTSDTQKFILQGLELLHNNNIKSIHDGNVEIKSSMPFWIGEVLS